MSVNYDKTIGVLVLPQQRPPTGISQHLPSPPTGSRWVPTGWRSKAFKNVGSITQAQENGGQDWVIQSRINAGSHSCVHVPQIVSIHLQPRGLGTPNYSSAVGCSHASRTGQQSHGLS